MRTRTLLLLPLLLLPLTPVLTAEEAKPEKEEKPAAAPAAKPEGQSSGFDIPISIGQSSTGVVIQDINNFGQEAGVMRAREATRISEDEVELGDLRMKLHGSKDQPMEMNITIEKAVFNLKTSILRSRSRVHIERKDFDLYGDAMEYNTITAEGQLFGDVTMIIHDADKLANPPKPKPDSAQSGESAAANVP